MAIHPVAWSDWASTPMTPTQVAGLCYVRSDNRAFMPKAKRWAAITTTEGMNSASVDICVFMDISQIGKTDSSIISW
jgi:hypothetical protein